MSSSPLAVRARDVGKMYTIVHNAQKEETLYAALSNRLRHPFRRAEKERFWALRDISFDIREGEVVGFIGKNGAGKSTLLKVLSRITEPTTGEIDLYGRVGSLLEVGTGFHPELTGRENIYLNGGILGMGRREIDRHFDEIVDFAGTEKFLDTPVKRYSSGMYVRLAFAVAAHLNPEILIIDEVLSVGDADFQKKCLGKMHDVAASGRTVLFVSHNMTAVLNLCTRAVLLAGGRMVADGNTADVVSRYLDDGQEYGVFRPDRGQRDGDRRVSIENFGITPNPPNTGEAVDLVFDLVRSEKDTTPVTVDLAVEFLADQNRVLQVYSAHVGATFPVAVGRTRITATVDMLPLTPGNYTIDLWVGVGDTGIDHIRDCYSLNVLPGCLSDGVFVDNRGSPVVAPSAWRGPEPQPPMQLSR